ncbi:MAG: glutaredoxin family protein [Burkholderiales bacterium]|nr:glutaredoxin family protein [Burkholderiales bacterium]
MQSGGEEDKLRLKLYGRSYCHLCDEMIAALAPLREEFGFGMEIIDVDSDAALEQRFGLLVPVLMHADTELCHYHLDTAKVRAYLANFR